MTRTNPHQPAISLIKRISYPESYKFSSTATSYGCTHEKDGREKYKSEMVTKHAEFEIQPCGFFVDAKAPYVGATPDGLVSCACCGKGVLEIKCPLCAKDADSLSELAHMKKQFCLEKVESGLQLVRKHPYYMQCLLQMHVTQRHYCDFVVWHPGGFHIERIKPDENLIAEALAKAECFFSLCILPELVGKWFTRKRDLNDIEVPAEDHEDEGTWCYCQESRGGDMVGCDNAKCSIKWFHLSCLEMSEPPSGKWMCPSCHPTKKQRIKGKSKN